MKSMTFSEKHDIEKVLASGEVTQDNVNRVISSFAKYNFSIKAMSDDENFIAISHWLKVHYKGYVETEFFDIIKSKIEAAHKYDLLESDDLIVYQSELDKITSSGDIRSEKILFTLLCVAKLQKNILGYKNGKYKFALTNIFKLARVHIPSKDRDMLMHNLYKLGFINAPFRNNDDSRWITYMSDGINDVEAFKVNEIDFEELAYVYENWKNKGLGFTRCKVCNRLIKDKRKNMQSKAKNPKKYCENCATEVTKANWREASNKYYNSHKN